MLGIRFWSKVDIQTLDGCWEWTATNVGGYGRYKEDRRYQQAHRLSYVALREGIPDGLQLDHLCRNPLCVNPEHLEPVTPEENTRRTQPFRAIKTHCKQGHAFTPENTRLESDRRVCRICDAAYSRRKYAKLRDAIQRGLCLTRRQKRALAT